MKIHPGNFNLAIRQTIIIFLFAGINFTYSFAQEQYQTSAGLLIIIANLEDKPVNIKSKELLIQLDYETGKIVIKQKISALVSDNDTIQSRLRTMGNDYMKFEGKLDLDYINTTGHPPLDFLIEGIVYPGNNHVIGTGRLMHLVEGTSSACLLSLYFKLELNKVFPEFQLAGLNNEIYVEVLQSLLARAND